MITMSADTAALVISAYEFGVAQGEGRYGEECRPERTALGDQIGPCGGFVVLEASEFAKERMQRAALLAALDRLEAWAKEQACRAT